MEGGKMTGVYGVEGDAEGGASGLLDRGAVKRVGVRGSGWWVSRGEGKARGVAGGAGGGEVNEGHP